MASVFHYTDTPGLLGILSSESLFATDYRYLNDTTEAGIIRSLILPILEAEVAEITPKLIQKGWLKKDFYDEHGVSGHRLQAEALYRSIVRAIDNITPFFVASFCRHEEGTPAFKHGLLSQWRGYAESGGFAIEFDEAGLDERMKEEHDSYAYVLTKQDSVLYERYDALFDQNIYKGVAGEMIWSVFETQGLDVSEVTGRKEIDPIILIFIKTAPFLKHWSFKEENEYRIVAACNRARKIPEGEGRPEKSIQFRSRNNLVTPYIELFDTSQKRFPIKSIIVGPHPLQDKQAEAVNMVLESEGIGAEIRLSEIPYRR